MNIQKFSQFFESKEVSTIFIIKQCFCNFEDEYSDIVDVNYNEINSNYFEININLKNKIKISEHEIDNLMSTIDSWNNRNIEMSRLMPEVKRSINAILNDEILNHLEIQMREHGFYIKLWTKIHDTTNNSDFIYVNDNYEVYHDKQRLMALLKNKFGVDVSRSRIYQDYDRHGHSYFEMCIDFKSEMDVDKVNKIGEFLSDIKIDIVGDNVEIFTGYHESGQCLYMTISGSIVDSID